MTSAPTGGDAPAAVVALFDELGDGPFVAYPSLTRDELLAVGDAPLLADTDDAAWWGGLEQATRAQILATAQRGLLARGLLAIDADDGSQVDLAPRLRTVLALRSAPAFVTLAGNLGYPSPVLRCYGVLGPDERVAVLVEARLITGVAEYLFCAPGYAAKVVAGVLLAPPDDADPDAVDGPADLGGRMVQRRLEIFPPGVPTGGLRYLASAGRTAAALTKVDADGQPGTSREVTDDSLTRLISDKWVWNAAAAVNDLGR